MAIVLEFFVPDPAIDVRWMGLPSSVTSQAARHTPEALAAILGVPGAPGSGLEMVRSVPSLEWVLNHNLGYKPSITIFSVGGIEIEASIIHVSANQSIVQFNVPTAGSARLV